MAVIVAVDAGASAALALLTMLAGIPRRSTSLRSQHVARSRLRCTATPERSRDRTLALLGGHEMRSVR